MKTLEHHLVRLAHDRWTALRRQHNNLFTTYGPGPEWEGLKAQKVDEFKELEILQQYCIANIEIIDELGLRGNISDYNGIVQPLAEVWRRAPFTDDDRKLMFRAMIEEVADESIEDRAYENLDNMDLCEAVYYACRYDEESFVSMLQYLAADEDNYVTGEFMRENGDPEEDHAGQLDFTKRMGLINEEETELTDLGREFVERYG